MKKKLEKRLKSLEAELQKGQAMMAKLEQERANLHNNMMRISGAIQVLKEELASEDEETCEKDNEEDNNGELTHSARQPEID